MRAARHGQSMEAELRATARSAWARRSSDTARRPCHAIAAILAATGPFDRSSAPGQPWIAAQVRAELCFDEHQQGRDRLRRRAAAQRSRRGGGGANWLPPPRRCSPRSSPPRYSVRRGRGGLLRRDLGRPPARRAADRDPRRADRGDCAGGGGRHRDPRQRRVRRMRSQGDRPLGRPIAVLTPAITPEAFDTI